MADDVNPALRAEIDAALAVIGPQIEGLTDLQHINASDEFISLVVDQYNAHVHREGLLQAVIVALDAVNAAVAALKADGYPDAAPVPVPSPLFAEVTKQHGEIEAAFALFVAEAEAARLAVSLGAPSDKPSPGRK